MLWTARRAIRPWLHRPVLSVTIVSTLALALCLSVTMSAVLDTASRQATVFPNGSNLVTIARARPDIANPSDLIPAPGFAEWRAQITVFSALGAYQRIEAPVAVGSVTRRTSIARVSGDLLAVLGVAPIVGRRLERRDEGNTSCSVVVVDTFAARWFGSRASSLGRELSVDGRLCRIAGVIDGRFAFPTRDVEVFEPMSFAPLIQRDSRGRTSVSIAQVRVVGSPKAGMRETALVTEAARYFGAPVVITSFRDLLTASYRGTLEVLWLCSFVVVLIAVFNVAGAIAGQSFGRTFEWGLKGALGGSVRAIWTEALSEGLVICTCGATVGLALAEGCTRLLRLRGPAELAAMEISASTLSVWVALTIVLGVLASAPAAWRASRSLQFLNVNRPIGSVAAGPNRTFAAFLVICQVACAITLVSVAMIFAATIRAGFFAPRGFQADTVTVLPTYRDVQGQAERDYAQLLDTARNALVGTGRYSDVALAYDLPVPMESRPFSIRRDDEIRGTIMHAEQGSTRIATIGDRYFAVMGIPLICGREFDDRESDAGDRLVVVSTSLARQWFESPANALGKSFPVAGLDGPAVVVGVVGDVRRTIWDRAELPVIYVHHAQVRRWIALGRNALLLVRSHDQVGNSQTVLDITRQAVPNLQLGQPYSVRQARIQEVAQLGAYLGVAAVFATVSLLLVALGTFATATTLVSRSVGELAVRQAIGATPREARKPITRRMFNWWSVAAVAGVCGSLGAARLVSWWQPGLAPLTLSLVLGSTGLITATVLLAAWLPLGRALRLDLVTLMRTE